MYHMYPGFSYGGMLWHYSSEIFLFVLVGLLVVFAVRHVAGWTKGRGEDVRPTPVERPSALEILKERYARGEIDTNEYEERKRVLTDAA